MVKAQITLKIVSPCGTYKETMKCVTMEEAEMYAKALRAEGSTVSIKDARKDSAEAQAMLARSYVRGVLDAIKAA